MKKIILLSYLFPSLLFAQIQAVGDTMLGEKVSPLLLEPVAEILSARDAVNIINLEGVITGADLPRKCSGGPYCYTFKMPPQTADILARGQIHVANLANNHSMDFGIQGQSDTASHLVKAGIKPVGIQAYPEALIEKNGRQYVIIGMSPHRNTVSLFTPLEDVIKKHKDLGRIVIMTAHLGAEGESAYKVSDKVEYFLGANRGNPVKIAHSLIDAGADLFIGHGPHVMRPLEIYKKRLIAYSLGNFLTYGTFSLGGKSGLGGVLRVNLMDDGSFESGEFFGFRQTKNFQPRLWHQGVALIASPEANDFLKEITKNHQDIFLWNDKKFILK